MTSIDINGSGADQVHVFQVNLPPEAMERFTTQAGTGEWPLKYALGANELRAHFVDVVAISDLGDMSLSTYMSSAHNATGPAFEQARSDLDALTGHVIILPAPAFAHTSQTLTIGPPLTHIGSYVETAPRASGPRVKSASAKGRVAAVDATSTPMPVPTKMLIGFLALAALAILLTFVF